MRAAQALFPRMQPRDDQKIIATANIIDREAALPELIAACQAVADAIGAAGKLSARDKCIDVLRKLQ
jgi:hypothetical protein